MDSIRTKLCRRPGIRLLTRPGTEHMVAYAMLKEIIESTSCSPESRGLDGDEFRKLEGSLEEYDLRRVGTLTGTDPGAIRAAALEYAAAEKAAIILTAGMNREGNAVVLAQAAANLALITGRLGKESCGVHILGEKANSQGAIDMGLAPDLLPGFHNIMDERGREKFERVWGAPLPRCKGLDARTILDRAEKKEIRALYIVGENPVETYPYREHVERALTSLDFLVVQDPFLTATAKMAHAVLPVASFAETNGTITSADRRVQRLRPVSESEGIKSDLEIFTALTTLMGKQPMHYAGPKEVMDEIATVANIYRGISYKRLEAGAIQWPCTDREDPGAAILYERGFAPGKPRLTPAPDIGDDRSKEGQMRLIPRTLKFHSGSFSQWSPTLTEVSPEAYVEISSQDLAKLELEDGDVVEITAVTGESVRLHAKESSRAVEGSIIVPHHFPALKLNRLTRWGQSCVMVRVDKERGLEGLRWARLPSSEATADEDLSPFLSSDIAPSL